MIIGLILLDQQNKYVSAGGKLPARPAFDKNLLTSICDGKQLICTGNTLLDLPPSLKKNQISASKGDVALSPETIDKYADMIIVSRSMETMKDGNTFRLDKFERLVAIGSLEIWNRI